MVTQDLTTSHTSYSIQWTEFVTRVTTFRVYGFPYTKGEVVITPPGIYQPGILVTGVDRVRLNSWPSQISTVNLTVGEGEPVQAKQSMTTDKNVFLWSVEKDRFNGRDYLRVNGGMWFYDYQSNCIVLPTYYRDPDSHNLVSIWQLNQTLYLDKVNLFTLKTLPSNIGVEYIVGLGASIDLACTAHGPGPSYQLEAECVQFISGESDGDTVPLPSGASSDKLPAIGDSVPLKNRRGDTMPMKWHVYNHSPIYWPSSVGWLVGNELPPGGWGDNQLMNVLTGNHGFNTADMGPGAVIGGIATGTVTLYGSPNTILSGNLSVYAKAKTIKTYHTATGSAVTTYRRTGGFRSGALIFGYKITDTVTAGRTGITSDIPRVLVYCRERDSTESLT
jgi:hypothetical protein